MGIHPLYVNERYFDRESKAMYYVLGAFFPGYNPTGRKGVKFTSSHRELVEIVKEELESEHAIVADSRGKSSYWIEMRSAHVLHSKLGELGLNVPKTERQFPRDIPEHCLDHFVRGFVDSYGFVHIRRGQFYKLTLNFGYDFLNGLREVLGMQGGFSPITQDQSWWCLTYGLHDSAALRDFIYQDKEYLKRRKLYLPAKKELLDRAFLDLGRTHKHTVMAQQRVEKAKALLRNGYLVKVAAREAGYRCGTSLFRAFRNAESMTPLEWQEKQGK